MFLMPDELPGELLVAVKQSGPPILLSDTTMQKMSARPVDVKRWCITNLKSFVWMQEQEVADFSTTHDYIYAFYITDQQDRNWFALRWEC